MIIKLNVDNRLMT